MGVFKTKKVLQANSAIIPEIAEEIKRQFLIDGFEVDSQSLISGGYDISLAKGNVFKAVIGMKSALKISIEPLSTGQIVIEAGIGIFGQQVIPAMIMWFVTWPVLVTQIWGMVQQAKLDDKVIAIAETVVSGNGCSSSSFSSSSSTSQSSKFCTSCGVSNSPATKFCGNCGKPL